MSTLTKYCNSRIDPYTLDKIPKHVSSEQECIESETCEYYPAIVAPTTPNEFGRIEIELPEIPYLENVIKYPFDLRCLNLGTPNLNRVSSDPNSAQMSYMIADQNGPRPHCVWLSPDLAGKTIDFSYFGLGTVINASNLTDLRVKTLTGKVFGSVDGESVLTETINGFLTKTKTDGYENFEVLTGMSGVEEHPGVDAWKDGYFYIGDLLVQFHTRVFVRSTNTVNCIYLEKNYKDKDSYVVLYNFFEWNSTPFSVPIFRAIPTTENSFNVVFLGESLAGAEYIVQFVTIGIKE